MCIAELDVIVGDNLYADAPGIEKIEKTARQWLNADLAPGRYCGRRVAVLYSLASCSHADAAMVWPMQADTKRCITGGLEGHRSCECVGDVFLCHSATEISETQRSSHILASSWTRGSPEGATCSSCTDNTGTAGAHLYVPAFRVTECMMLVAVGRPSVVLGNIRQDHFIATCNTAHFTLSQFAQVPLSPHPPPASELYSIMLPQTQSPIG
jgi:hypothetical protein